MSFERSIHQKAAGFVLILIYCPNFYIGTQQKLHTFSLKCRFIEINCEQHSLIINYTFWFPTNPWSQKQKQTTHFLHNSKPIWSQKAIINWHIHVCVYIKVYNTISIQQQNLDFIFLYVQSWTASGLTSEPMPRLWKPVIKWEMGVSTVSCNQMREGLTKGNWKWTKRKANSWGELFPRTEKGEP